MKKVFRSNIKRAVFVVRDTYEGPSVAIWPVRRGLKKERGCVMFNPATSNFDKTMLLQECQLKYHDHPETGEAWLVYPCKNGIDYWWERVDQLIDFS